MEGREGYRNRYHVFTVNMVLITSKRHLYTFFNAPDYAQRYWDTAGGM